MKVLLLNPPDENKLFRDSTLSRCVGVSRKAPYLWPPIGLAYIAGYIRDIVDVKILDCHAENLDSERALEHCNGYEIVIISAGMSTMKKDISFGKKLKEMYNCKIALVGSQATYFHDKIINEEGVDFVIRGEPERIIKNLCKEFEKGFFGKVKGLTWKDKFRVRINPDENLIENLDEIPFAARDLLPNDKYYDITARKKRITLSLGSRGCPFQCAYCSTKVYNGKIYRTRSPDNIKKEFENLKSQGFDDVFFFDDLFVFNKKRILEICEKIKELKMSWRCESRVDTVDREMLEKMKEAGCYQIQIGVESGNQIMLDKMKKGTKVEQIKQMFKWCNELGIETVAYMILGYPGETRESALESINLMKEIKPNFLSFNVFNPIPGSDIYESMKKKIDLENADFASISFCDLPNSEVMELVQKGYKDYYLRFGYLTGQIGKARNLGDVERFVKRNIKFWAMREGNLWKNLTK